MLDGISLSEYKLTDGSKINLVVKREAATSTHPATSTKQPTTEAEAVDEPDLLVEEELFKVLRKHFKSDADTKKVVASFKQVLLVET